MPSSAFIPCNFSKISLLVLISITFILFSIAQFLTGFGVKSCFLPIFLSVVVTTATRLILGLFFKSCSVNIEN